MKLIVALAALVVLYYLFFAPGHGNDSNDLAADRIIDTTLLSKCDLPIDEPVIVFTATWCGACAQLKSSLNSYGIAYYEVDAEKTRAGRQAFRCTGGNGYPHLLVEGRSINVSSGRALTNALAPYRS